ncbi:hypothetical protein WJX82_003996 [Trebouxia sp. C0006]
MAMEAATETQRLQITLQELIDFLGKTYITTCEEVARTEHAVQSNMRIVQELQAAVSQRNNVVADQSDAPSLPAFSQVGQMPTSGNPVHSAEAEESPTPVAASATDLSGPASARSTQHDKLQAVLAQARAIRGQDKPQASIGSNPQPIGTAAATSMEVQQQVLQHKLGSGSSASQSAPAESAQSQSMESQWTQTMPLQLPAYFRKALNAFRRPSSQQQAQSPASATAAASSSCGPFINLTDTYNESLASIAHAGKAFQDAVTAADTPQEQAKQSWANPEAQSWLRHSALVQAQLLLMQRLTARLDAQQPGRDENLASSSADADQDTLQLWKEVQQEYHVLFETPAADPDAVNRWRNRALRFALPSNSNAPDVVRKPAAGNQSEGFAANKPAEAWLPEACWKGLPASLVPSASSLTRTAADHDPSSILLPGGRGGETGEAATISYTSLSQLQTVSRLQHQLQLYLRSSVDEACIHEWYDPVFPEMHPIGGFIQ